jgi:hypothetical protein
MKLKNKDPMLGTSGLMPLILATQEAEIRRIVI